MPLPLWIKQLLGTSGQQRRDRARSRRQNDEIELSLMRLEDRRVLNASGLELAAAAPTDSGGTGDGGSQIAAAESTPEQVEVRLGAPPGQVGVLAFTPFTATNADTTPPTIETLQLSDNAFNEADTGITVTLTVTFNEAMTTDGSANPTLSTNADSTLTSAGNARWVGTTQFLLDYKVADADVDLADVTFDVSLAKDVANNTMEAVTGQSTVPNSSVDMVTPTVTVEQSDTQSDSTDGSPINFTVVFSESVTGFGASDVTVGGTAPGTLSAKVTGETTTYNVAVSGMTGSGTVTASLDAAVAFDAAGNPSDASESTDNSVRYDVTEIHVVDGDLVLEDTTSDGRDDNISVKSDGTNIIITSDHALSTTVGTLSNAGKTATVSLSEFTGDIVFKTQGGEDVLTVNYSFGNFTREVYYQGGDSSHVDKLVLTGAPVGGGSFTDASFAFTNANDGSIDVTNNSTIHYTGLEPITSTITAANVTLNYSNAAETITVTGSGGQTTVTAQDASMAATAETITFDNPTVSLTINAGATNNDTVDVTDFGLGFAAAVTIDGQGGGANIVNWNTTQSVGAIDITSEAINLTSGTVNSGTSHQVYRGAVLLANTGTATAITASDVTFHSSLDGSQALTVNASGLTAFHGAVGGGTALSSVLTDADGSTDINGGLVKTTGDQTYNDVVELTADTTVEGTNLTFTLTVDSDSNGPWDLTADSQNGGTTKFDGAVGATGALKNLTTNGDGTTEINGGSVTTTESQTYNDAVLLRADTVLTGTVAIHFGAPVTSLANSLVLDSDGTVSQATDGEIDVSNLTLLGKATFDLTAPENDFDVLAADTKGVINVVDKDDLTVGANGGVAGISNRGGGNVNLTAGTMLTVNEEINNSGGGDTTLEATTGNLVINAGLANLGGDGRIVGRAGGDVLVQEGTRIETSMGFIQATAANASSIDPIVTLTPVDQGGSNVDSQGNAFVDVTVDAPDGQKFEILIDWGDGTVDRYLLAQDAPFDGTQVFRFGHTYTAHPDPTNPADPIPVSATVAFDGRQPATGGAGDNGISFFRNTVQYIDTTVSDVLTTPGDGVFGYIIIVKNEIEPVQLRRVRSEVQSGGQGAVTTGQDNLFDVQTSEQEYGTTSSARLFLRRVDSSGKESDDVPLDISLLEDGLLPALSRLPNGRYRVYYQEQNSQGIRMVREVEVYQGRVVPPDFRSDVSERQPSSTPAAESKDQSDEPKDTKAPSEEPLDASPTPTIPSAGEEPAETQAPSTTGADAGRDAALGTAAVAMGLTEFGGGRRWSEQIDRAYAAGGRARRNATRRNRSLHHDQAE